MFYLMPETKRVSANYDTSTEVQMVVFVRPNTPTFNSLSFVDNDGKIFTSNAIGDNPLTESVITYNITIPAGKSIQDVKILAKNNAEPICNTTAGGSLPLCSNTAYVYRQGLNTGYLNVEPRYAIESPSYNKQVITVTNQGNESITNFKMPTDFSAPLRLDSDYPNSCNDITTLAPGANCSFRVKYNSANPISGYRDFIFSYNDGVQQQVAMNTISYIGTQNESYALIIVSPELTILNQVAESMPVTFTNIGTLNANYFHFDLIESNYPVYIVNNGSCQNLGNVLNGDSYSLIVGGSCTANIGFFGPTTTAGSTAVPYAYENSKGNDTIGTFVVNYPVSTIVSPTELIYVSPESTNSPEYYTTVTLKFLGNALNQSTVNGSNIELLSSINNTTIGLTAPIFESGYGSDGVPYTSVNFASLNELTAQDYKIVIQNISNLKNIYGAAVTLGANFTTSIPLVTFTAQGIVNTFDYCNNESCIKTINSNNTLGMCHLLDNGGIVGCTDPIAQVEGLSGASITAASIYGFDNGSGLYDLMSFITGTSSGTFGDINVVSSPFSFTSFSGVNLSNTTGIANIPNYTYVVSSGSIYQCSGNNPMSNCTQLSMTNAPTNAYGIYVDNSSDLSQPIMLITNRNSNSVTTCTSNNGGDFTNASCISYTTLYTDYGSQLIFNQPTGVVAFLNQQNGPAYADGEHYAFFTNSGFVGRGYDGAITRCKLSSQGELSSCNYFGFELYSNPLAVSVMETGMDRYFNVSNQNGSMTTCSVDNGGYYCNRYGYTGTFESSLQIMQFQS